MSSKWMLLLATMCFIPSAQDVFAEGINTPLGVTQQRSGQVKKASGRVLDENGDPLIGVTVRVTGTNIATVTDLDGRFSLSTTAGSKSLEFSYVGYKGKTTSIGENMKVTLSPSDDQLNEVVVVGYGTMKRRDLTGAISTVSSADIKQAPVMNAMEGLQGKISGLDIVRESGQAGTSPSVLLRGTRSLNADCSPLYVIDGVSGGSIDNLNPNDIESIEVLKDASSTAIYGSAGANGVIIITTKQGKKGRVQVDFDGYVGINAFPSYPSPLTGNDWIEFQKERYRSRYDQEPADLDELFNAIGMTQGAVDAYNKGRWVDWKDEMLHTGVQQNYNVSVRGGGENLTTYMSAGYMQEKGLYKHDKQDKLTFRTGTTYNLAKFIDVGYQSTLVYTNLDRRQSRLNKCLSQLPLGDVYNEDGSLNYYPISDMNSYVNILADDELSAYQNNTKSTYVRVAPFVDIKPFKGFTFHSMFNASLSHARQGVWDGLNTYMKLTGSQDNKRTADYNSTNGWSYLWQNVATYNFQIHKDHDFTITGITEYSKSKTERATAQNERFDYDNFLWYNLSAGLQPYASSNYREVTKMSYALRLAYNYKSRYLLTASTRWDGASQLYNKWDAFPAVAVGWRISDEPFMKRAQGWLDNLKLRVGYGITGNANIDPYVTLTAVTNSANYLNLGTGQVQSYILARNVANYDLSWEKSYNWNVGLDFSVLKNRINGSLEWYSTDTKGVLYNRPLPTAFGSYNAKQTYYKMSNIATIKNKGFEATINSVNIDKRNFRWTSTFTFSTNKEKLTKIDLGNNISVNDLIALNLFMDEPVNTFYGYKKTGIWQLGEEDQAGCFSSQPGDVKLNVPGLSYDPNYQYTTTKTTTDADGNKVTQEVTHTGAYYKASEDQVDANGNVVHKYYTINNPYTVGANDRQILGHKNPDWTIGFQNQFQFYNFDLSVMMTMRWGQMIDGQLLGYSNGTNQPDSYDYWTPTNPTNAYPRPRLGGGMTDAQKAAMTFVNGSFFKIKNITLGYTLPQNVLQKLGLSRLRLYGTIQNPFIWSKSDMLKGMDPENSASDAFPLFKTLVFGVNVSF